jgi:pimeloyl-ACP methyl ester carboxylesterase
MKVYFSHGKSSGPRGQKIAALSAIAQARGCFVKSVDYTDERDPDRRTERLLRYLLMEPNRCILVGTSTGAYVSLRAAERVDVKALFLLAPALYQPGYPQRHYQPNAQRLEIVHGWSDRREPPENSITFAREMDATLHLIPGDHGLRRSIGAISSLFERFLDNALSQEAATRSFGI